MSSFLNSLKNISPLKHSTFSPSYSNTAVYGLDQNEDANDLEQFLQWPVLSFSQM
jgi:hypothetical protein